MADEDTTGVARYFDVSGSVPVPKIGVIASAVVGSVMLGGFWGVIEFINTIFGGLFSTLEGFGVWLYLLVDGTFNVGIDPLGRGFEANAEFLKIFGAWAQAVAVVEVAVLMWLLWWSAKLVGSAITGGNS